MQQLMTARQVGQRLGVCATTVLRYFRKGELKGYRFNSRNVRFGVDDVEEWIKRPSIRAIIEQAEAEQQAAMEHRGAQIVGGRHEFERIGTEDMAIPEQASSKPTDQNRRQLAAMIDNIRANPANHVAGANGQLMLAPKALEEVRLLRTRLASLKE